MNFTWEIKRNLLRRLPDGACCRNAMLAGFFTAGGGSRERELISFTTEREEIASFVLEEAERLFQVRFELAEILDFGRRKDKLTFRYVGPKAEKILDKIDEFSHPKKDCCIRSFLAGAYLGGGSCTLPKEGTKTGYHLEVGFDSAQGAESFGQAAEEFEILTGVICRGGRSVVYLKSREAISDFLAVIGAEGALKTLDGVAAEREERNYENRKSNCYAGNADKAAIASAAQVIAIEKMMADGAIETLLPALKETAVARLDNPELSLSELAAKLSITKSCLNHRLRKIIEKSRN